MAGAVELERSPDFFARTQPPPFARYFTAEDNLRIASMSRVLSVEVTVRLRWLLPDGTVQASVERHLPASNRVYSTQDIPTPEGWLIGAEIHASLFAPRIGECWVVLDVVRGSGAQALVLDTVLQGYVTDTSRLAFPGSPLRSSIDGPGALRSITGTDPAAATEISETVPTNARWRLLAFDVALVTDATVANREVVLTIDDGATVLIEVPSAVAHAASLTRRYSFARGVQRATPAASTVISAPAPDVALQGGYRVRTVTTGLQAGDNYGAPQLLVEEWIED